MYFVKASLLAQFYVCPLFIEQLLVSHCFFILHIPKASFLL